MRADDEILGSGAALMLSILALSLLQLSPRRIGALTGPFLTLRLVLDLFIAKVGGLAGKLGARGRGFRDLLTAPLLLPEKALDLSRPALLRHSDELSPNL